MSCQHTWERRDKQTWCLPYYICTECEMELSIDQYNALQQAHREGWEQCKREAKQLILDNFACSDHPRCDHDWCGSLVEITDAIASMTYKEAQHDTN